MEKKNILGSMVSQVKNEQLDHIFTANDYSRAKYICVANVHSVVIAVKHQEMQQALNNAWINLPDGKPLAVYGNLKYKPKKFERVTGPDLMAYLLNNSERLNLTHYFFGGREETLKMIGEKVRNKQVSGIKGYFSPPFRPWREEEILEYFKRINELKPKIIWVGLGAPKQELFMFKHIQKLKYGVMIGVGAAFDYYTGRIKRAPRWMQSISLEWLYRVFQEPRRLWKRYLSTNSRFLLLALKNLLKKSKNTESK